MYVNISMSSSMKSNDEKKNLDVLVFLCAFAIHALLTLRYKVTISNTARLFDYCSPPLPSFYLIIFPPSSNFKLQLAR